MDATFLTEKQIWGDDQGSGQLQAMKGYGTKTGMSDLAIVLGGLMGSSKTSDNQRTGYVWSASSFGDGYVRYVHVYGGRYFCYPNERLVGARPALPSSVTSKIQPSEARLTQKIGDVQVVEYGEYPQTIAPENINKELEGSFSRGQLGTTGKKYTFDGEESDAYDKPFKAKEYAEYEHRGKRYIRVEAKPYDSNSVLSNGKTPQKGEACWIEVQPIEWLKDPSGVMVTRQALFSGVQFDRNQSYDGKFAKTDMKQYLDKFFAKEMLGLEANLDVPAFATFASPQHTLSKSTDKNLIMIKAGFNIVARRFHIPVEALQVLYSDQDNEGKIAFRLFSRGLPPGKKAEAEEMLATLGSKDSTLLQGTLEEINAKLDAVLHPSTKRSLTI